MIKYIFLVALTFVFVGCSEEVETTTTDETSLQDNFTISGDIEGGGNKSFYLEALSQQGTISVAQARSDASGHFEMVGNIPGFGLYQLKMGEGNQAIIPLTLVPEDKINIKSDTVNYVLSPIVSGSSWAKTMTSYMKLFSKFHVGQAELMSHQNEWTPEVLTQKFNELKAPIDSFSIANMKKDPSNPFNIVLQGSATPSMGFQNWDTTNLEVLKLVASAYQEKFPNSPVTNTLSTQVTQIEMAYDAYIRESSGVMAAPEIALNNPEGEEIKLSSLRGKYVLIDFWASWCRPCRQENPNVVRLYNKYKNKGFTVFSVSLDSDAEAWKDAIEKDGLIWPNHVSDLMQWNSPMPSLYGFNGIPHTVLVNPEGNIIGTKLRGESLEQKLKEIFSN